MSRSLGILVPERLPHEPGLPGITHTQDFPKPRMAALSSVPESGAPLCPFPAETLTSKPGRHHAQPTVPDVF